MLPYGSEWLDEAKADVRIIEQATAMRLFEGILRFSRSGTGDVTGLHGELAGASRLRIGDYRVLFTLKDVAQGLGYFQEAHKSQYLPR